MNKTQLISILCALGYSAKELKDFTETELWGIYFEKTC